jgi:hypothetical protein
MRKIMALLAVAMALAMPSAQALACPDTEYEQCFLGACICLPKLSVPKAPDVFKIIINPVDYIDPTGIPQQGDFNEFVIKDPEAAIELATRPTQWPYLPVAYSIISGRNAIINGGNRIPDHVMQAMRPWFDYRLLLSVRWKADWDLLHNTLQTAQMYRDRDTRAIALINGVLFRNAAEANDLVLWAHELRHVQQYHDWGVFEFARRWTNNSSNSGEVEAEAFAFERQFADTLAAKTGGGGPISAPIPGGYTGPLPPPVPPPPAMGTRCVTPVGQCPWINPVGWQCSCALGGNLYGGTVQ